MGKTSATVKNKYRDKTYDRVEFVLPKGKKPDLQAHAEAQGESVNSFINRAIDETVERDNASQNATSWATEGEGGS